MGIADEIKEATPPPANKSSWVGGCAKGCLIVFVILLVVGSVAGYFGYKAIGKRVKELIPPQPTTLTIDKGTVTGKSGSMVSGAILNDGDLIKTGEASAATIVLPNGSETRLDENTSLTITATGDSVSLFQNLGRSWSRVVKLSGAKESFEIETPTAVATVRGTAFATTVLGEDSTIDTDEGQVEVAAIEKTGGRRKILQKITVDAGNSTSVRKSDLNDLRANRKQLVKEITRQELKDSDWFKINRERQVRPRPQTNPLELLKTVQDISPEDLNKFQALAAKVQNLTPEQVSQIEAIAKKYEGVQDPSQVDPMDAARMMAIIDPSNFSDVDYWSRFVGKYLPILKSLEKLDPESTNSDLFNSLQDLPAIGIPNKIQ